MLRQDFDNFLMLIAWGFNVPTFLENVFRNHKRNIPTIIKSILGKGSRLDLLIDDGKQCRIVENISIQDAVLSGAFLEKDKSSRVLYMEHVNYLWNVNIVMHSDCCGYYSIDNQEKINFSYLEDIKDIKIRSMCRECFNLLKKFRSTESISIVVGWSDKFFGLKPARYCIKTFSILG